MAVGDYSLPPLSPVAGVRIGVTSAGVKTPGRKDLVIFEIAKGAKVAAVFTRNKFCAAPVHIARRHLQQCAPEYLLINTGNANAGTGSRGLQAALVCCQHVANLVGCEYTAVLPFSTGVIGELLPTDTILGATADALAQLDDNHWLKAAEGIMTTDTRPKGASVTAVVSGEPITITGICKGAGMIKPDMATMLAYVATNASIAKELLQQLIKQAVELSFNRITVDSDTSTNDACLLIATGRTNVAEYSQIDDPLWQPFRQALNQLFLNLAQAIVRDAEGATKFIEVRVIHALTSADALEVAYTIAHSPLVKTAFFASDPNWGRILAAIGRSEVVALDVNRVSVWLGKLCIVENGERAADYEEQAGQQIMAEQEITICVDLSMGEICESVWTSDLSHEYVRINAEYRT
jgi:glutamate N-acetyltransferase/amino-acid N-acetyltransferase